MSVLVVNGTTGELLAPDMSGQPQTLNIYIERGGQRVDQLQVALPCL